MKSSILKVNALAAVAISALMVSCGSGNPDEPVINREEPKPVITPTELLLSTRLEEQTKAAYTAADTQFPAGQTVCVWVNESTGGATALYEKNVLTANGSGGLSGGSSMFFPQNDNNVDIYALHTNATLSGNAYPTATITHSVSSDQRTLLNYAVSDLSYARTTGVAKTTNSIPLTFYHLLSKVQVAVVPGDGLSASDITGVAINGTKLQAGLTLAKATVPTSIVISPAGAAAPITIGKDMSANFVSPQYNDAIIVPQTVTAGTAFITIYMTDGVELAYLLPANTTFESRKKYIYHITVSRTEISLTTSISDWLSGGLVTGEASHLQ